METVYCEDSRQRIQHRIASAVKSKLMGNGIENADELSVKFTEMMATGHSKEEVLSELEKYSKVDDNKTVDQVERHNKSFVDWLFGYSSIVSAVTKDTVHTPLTEADTEVTTESQLNNQPSSIPTPPIEDITDDEDDNELDNKESKIINENSPAAIAESVLRHEPSTDDIDIDDSDEDIEDDSSSDESDDLPELEGKESANEQAAEPHTEEQKNEAEEKAPEEEKKPELPKRRSFIRIKEGKSGRFTPIKSEDRHSFVKRNLARVATQLDVASQVQKKMMSHAVAVANASENQTLNKKKSTASLNNSGLEKKKSFRRDSITSNGSSTPSVYSSTNATFIQSFANKTFPKTTNTSNVTPDKSKVVRCSYWPNCNRGDECKFWHPKELCPNLNNCPDGDQCLYIHPAVPQSQLNKNKKKKSEASLEVSENFTIPKHTLQKKSSRISLNGSVNQQPSLVKKISKANLKDISSVTSNSSLAIECKYGANCTRPDCKFSHPSPAAILAAAGLKKKDSKILKEKKSHDILKHKESRSKLISSEYEDAEEAQTILVNN
ncbi:hypothetical protein PIROE2DRAFT_6995 [Piromyces sp. E2]|nr:hypothetical protein PIROE2DRAFT_6995 [Piromyces sp. E2]|eukprot:OUM65924.1 hypothetical protein PIROE2DRAFT_6995 [Piromyces sp. E2]